MSAYTVEKTYPPANRCIYCGDASEPLRREHIIPYALNGRLILPKASCLACQKIINEEIEQPCLKKMFRTARTHLQLQSKSGLPEQLPITSTPGDAVGANVPFEIRNTAVKEHPFMFFLPGFSPPTAMLGKPPAHTLVVERIIRYMEPGWERKLAALGYTDPCTYIGDEIPFRPFARFLAKIAHGFLFAELSGQPFRPLLPDIILGKAPRDFKSHYVGGPTGRTHGNLGGHGLKLRTGERFLIVEISLFGCAPYEVVAGVPP